MKSISGSKVWNSRVFFNYLYLFQTIHLLNLSYKINDNPNCHLGTPKKGSRTDRLFASMFECYLKNVTTDFPFWSVRLKNVCWSIIYYTWYIHILICTYTLQHKILMYTCQTQKREIELEFFNILKSYFLSIWNVFEENYTIIQ